MPQLARINKPFNNTLLLLNGCCGSWEGMGILAMFSRKLLSLPTKKETLHHG